MTPRIETIPEKKLIGKRLKMSLTNNRTMELWQSFMPLRNNIKNRVSNDLYSLRVYNDPNYFRNFDPAGEFEKWALAEVDDFSAVPDGMEPFSLPRGLYAVFHYIGRANEGEQMFRYIFTSWLPNSEYELDNRPHFEILGEKYKTNEPDSEEDIWVPVKRKDNTVP